MHVEVTRIDVDRMIGIPEADPVFHAERSSLVARPQSHKRAVFSKHGIAFGKRDICDALYGLGFFLRPVGADQIPFLPGRVSADDEEICGRFKAAMAGACGQHGDIAGANSKVSPLSPPSFTFACRARRQAPHARSNDNDGMDKCRSAIAAASRCRGRCAPCPPADRRRAGRRFYKPAPGGADCWGSAPRSEKAVPFGFVMLCIMGGVGALFHRAGSLSWRPSFQERR